MRLLVLNDYFDQDIQALQAAGGDAVGWRVRADYALRWDPVRDCPERVVTEIGGLRGRSGEFRRFPMAVASFPAARRNSTMPSLRAG